MSSNAYPMSSSVQVYDPPALLRASGSSAQTKEWAIFGLALALCIAWFGSAWAFCWAVCHGRVSSCSTSGPFWARAVKAVCHP